MFRVTHPLNSLIPDLGSSKILHLPAQIDLEPPPSVSPLLPHPFPLIRSVRAQVLSAGHLFLSRAHVHLCYLLPQRLHKYNLNFTFFSLQTSQDRFAFGRPQSLKPAVPVVRIAAFYKSEARKGTG
jgi:hypothetical protein